MRGVINLDKPVGPTSHDMVGLVRRLTRTRRIGHAGTLDPLASGLLPILVGTATRFSEELTGGHKRYDAVFRLGRRSATDDGEGPIEPGGPPPSSAEVEAALPRWVGTFPQHPPAFSARKVAGRAAYRAARAGEPVELAPRDVTIEALELLGTVAGDGWLDVRVDLRCGPGTYVRSVARDLGDALGCGGYLHALRRTGAAGLLVADAVTPDRLVDLAAAGRIEEVILPVGDLLSLPRLDLAIEHARRFASGAAVPVGGREVDGRHVVWNGETLLGIGHVGGGVLRPLKVIAEPAGVGRT